MGQLCVFCNECLFMEFICVCVYVLVFLYRRIKFNVHCMLKGMIDNVYLVKFLNISYCIQFWKGGSYTYGLIIISDIYPCIHTLYAVYSIIPQVKYFHKITKYTRIQRCKKPFLVKNPTATYNTIARYYFYYYDSEVKPNVEIY